jgi:hypothetical protein
VCIKIIREEAGRKRTRRLRRDGRREVERDEIGEGKENEQVEERNITEVAYMKKKSKEKRNQQDVASGSFMRCIWISPQATASLFYYFPPYRTTLLSAFTFLSPPFVFQLLFKPDN